MGPPMPCLGLRLESVSEMNYDATAIPPRGEVTRNCFLMVFLGILQPAGSCYVPPGAPLQPRLASPRLDHS